MKTSASVGFAARLRQETRSVQTRSEKTTFIRGFLRGTACSASYVRLLAALHPIYQAMEEETRRLAAINPLVARFHFPELFRTAALERDLVLLAGPTWAHDLPTTAASQTHAQRIRLVAIADPIRVISHLSTRYIGDLAGAPVLARIAERSLGLAHGAGLDFYDFDAVPDRGAMKARFEARIDELEALPDAATEAVIDEANLAFQYSIAVFESLEGNAFTSFFRNLPLPGVRAARRSLPAWCTPAAAH